MLVIDYNQSDTRTINAFQVYVGEGCLRTIAMCFGGGSVDLSVQADGDELEKIKQQLTYIPMHNGRVVRWTGETARFIVNNLVL